MTDSLRALDHDLAAYARSSRGEDCLQRIFRREREDRVMMQAITVDEFIELTRYALPVFAVEFIDRDLCWFELDRDQFLDIWRNRKVRLDGLDASPEVHLATKGRAKARVAFLAIANDLSPRTIDNFGITQRWLDWHRANASGLRETIDWLIASNPSLSPRRQAQ